MLKATRSANTAKDTTGRKTVTPLFRVLNNANGDVIYRVRNGESREYLVTISTNGTTGCTQCENDDPCPSTKSGRKCYHIKECVKLEESRKEEVVPVVEEIVPSVPDSATTMLPECPVGVSSLPTECPRDDEEFSEDVAERWTQEALSREAYVALFGIYDLSY